MLLLLNVRGNKIVYLQIVNALTFYSIINIEKSPKYSTDIYDHCLKHVLNLRKNKKEWSFETLSWKTVLMNIHPKVNNEI